MARANLEDLLASTPRGTAIPAFTCYNLEGAIGVIEAAENLKTAVCILLSDSSFKGRRGDLLCQALVALADASTVPACVQLDHVTDLQRIAHALELGVSSVMADGSKLPDADNAQFVREAMTLAAHFGATVEAELGRIEGDEDRATNSRAGRMTAPDTAARFVDETGIAVLAVSIGNVHGTYHRPPDLDWCRLADIQKSTAAHLSFHGASGVSNEDIATAIRTGIVKINVNTELREQWFAATRESLPHAADGWQILPVQEAVTSAIAVAARGRILAYQAE